MVTIEALASPEELARPSELDQPRQEGWAFVPYTLANDGMQDALRGGDGHNLGQGSLLWPNAILW